MEKYNCILIPAQGVPTCVELLGGDRLGLELKRILNADTTCVCCIDFTKAAGYALAVFGDDAGQDKQLRYNALGSLIVGAQGPVLGDCILVDDYKILTLDDLSKILDLAQRIYNS